MLSPCVAQRDVCSVWKAFTSAGERELLHTSQSRSGEGSRVSIMSTVALFRRYQWPERYMNLEFLERLVTHKQMKGFVNGPALSVPC
jgi:hypothetical protein